MALSQAQADQRVVPEAAQAGLLEAVELVVAQAKVVLREAQPKVVQLVRQAAQAQLLRVLRAKQAPLVQAAALELPEVREPAERVRLALQALQVKPALLELAARSNEF